MTTKTKQTLAIGQDDFRKIREQGKYYVDKTLLIQEFLSYANEVTLITRPRRFGKTLNMTMIRDFFDKNAESQAIFAGLAIMETEYAKLINTIPVISLSLKSCSGETPEKMEASIAEEIFKEYKKYAKVLSAVDKSDGSYLRFFQTLEILRYAPPATDKQQAEKDKLSFIEHIQKNITHIENSLAYLLEALYTFYGVRPILLIDEYDNPIIEAHISGFREKFTRFYSTFLTVALKSNQHLGQAILTGIQRVAKESIFSKLNNLVVYTTLSRHYSAYFGLTEAETSSC